MTRPQPPDRPASSAGPDASHYFDESPSAPSSPRRIELTLPDLHVALTTDRGVFSAERVDPGTKYLLLDAPTPPPDARVLLDLGCGYGPIAIALARRCPGAAVWAVDVNERARSLCQANAEAAGCANVRVAAPDDVPADLVVDGLWSNPPVRVGKDVLHGLLRTWLPRLHPDAHAYLVVQKHLGSDSLASWMTTEGWVVSRLGSRKAYRILDVSAPSQPSPGASPIPGANA
jgi:16S rRNA (guanine1207-N2)-methyltransferase